MLHHMLRAAAQRAFSTLDPYFKYVTMLLHGDGSALGSDTVTPFNSDASTNAFNVTINGDARSNNFNPYQAGYYSNSFNGSSDYLTVASNTAFQFSTGDFTIELWFYMNALTGGNQHLVDMRGASSSALAPLLYVTSGGVLYYYTAGTNQITGATLSAGQWYHIALARSGTSTKLFVNGTQSGSTLSDSTNYIQSSVFLARASDAAGGYANGLQSNVRLVKGTAVYTSNFTPSTTPLTAITNTSLLTCQSNRFIDNSTNAFTVTANGSPQVASAQPFTLPSSVATYGSGYFDGSGDYLDAGTNAVLGFGTGDFTIEAWIYRAASGTFPVYTNGPTSAGSLALYILSDVVRVDYYGGSSLAGATTVALNSWNHVAVIRSGSTLSVYLNGVRDGTTTTSSNNTTSNGVVGRDWTNSTAYPNGYISNARVVKGTAVYTGTTYTVPTSPLTAITNTSLLTTQYNGAGNNNGFKDSSQNNFTITRNGNTTQGTFTPYGSNWSNYFDGATSTRLTLASNAAFAFGTGAYTVEAWVNIASITTQSTIFDAGAGSGAWDLAVLTTGAISIGQYGVGAVLNSSSSAVTLNTWVHVAAVRSSTATNDTKIYANGVLVGTGTDSNNWTVTTTPSIGGYNLSGYSMNGYISNLRVVKGTAVYTSTFTPSTTPITAITNTSLLTCQSNRFVDNSTNAFAITTSGSPSVQRFSPFSPTTAYSTSVIGGSGYFDGSGDYLTAAQNAAFNFGTGAFTVEAWVYITASNGTNQRIIGLGDGAIGGGPYTGWSFNINNNLTTINWYRYDGTETDLNASYTFKTNTWYHIVAVRNGSSNLSMFVNGSRVYNNTSASLTYSNVNTNPLYVGLTYDGAGGGGNKFFNGYMSSARIVAGSAVYDPTASTLTVPTAPLTAITNTSLLLSYTNAGILDNAMMNDLETVGNAQISTSVKKYGTGSMYFDGSGDYAISYNPNLYIFGTGDFTVEAWVYPTSFPAEAAIITTATSTDYQGLTVNVGTSGNIIIALGAGGSWTVVTTSGGTLSANTWQHIALTRSGNVFRMFVSGTQSYTTTNSVSLTNTNNAISVGGRTAGGGQYFNGYIDDLRITKGVARYTANFTAPTAAFPNN